MDSAILREWLLAPLSQPGATVIAALIAFMGGLWTADRVYRQKSDELFFSALNFLKGGSQNRNLGIAAIDLYWHRRRHRPLCVSLLSGSAIYLIRGSKQQAAAHELYNLERIIALLLSAKPARDTEAAYIALQKVVATELADRAGNGGRPTGLHVPTSQLSKWAADLAALLS